MGHPNLVRNLECQLSRCNAFHKDTSHPCTSESGRLVHVRYVQVMFVRRKADCTWSYRCGTCIFPYLCVLCEHQMMQATLPFCVFSDSSKVALWTMTYSRYLEQDYSSWRKDIHSTSPVPSGRSPRIVHGGSIAQVQVGRPL